MRILREGVINGVIVNPGATEALQHDDQVDVVSGLPLTYVPYPPSFLSMQSFDYHFAVYNGKEYVVLKRLERSGLPFPSTAARLLVRS